MVCSQNKVWEGGSAKLRFETSGRWTSWGGGGGCGDATYRSLLSAGAYMWSQWVGNWWGMMLTRHGWRERDSTEERSELWSSHTHTHAHSRAHARMHTHTHTHTHAHAHTHTHTHNAADLWLKYKWIITSIHSGHMNHIYDSHTSTHTSENRNVYVGSLWTIPVYLSCL